MARLACCPPRTGPCASRWSSGGRHQAGTWCTATPTLWSTPSASVNCPNWPEGPPADTLGGPYGMPGGYCERILRDVGGARIRGADDACVRWLLHQDLLLSADGDDRHDRPARRVAGDRVG